MRTVSFSWLTCYLNGNHWLFTLKRISEFSLAPHKVVRHTVHSEFEPKIGNIYMHEFLF